MGHALADLFVGFGRRGGFGPQCVWTAHQHLHQLLGTELERASDARNAGRKLDVWHG